jgi:single-strand DNA-binding protein
MFQQIIAIGHLGRDPEIRYLPSGDAVTSMNLATSRKWKDAAGDPKEETIWWRVSVFGKMAEVCADALFKGSLVMVKGQMREPRAWLDKSTGEPRSSLEIKAESVQFLDKKGAKHAGDEDAMPVG